MARILLLTLVFAPDGVSTALLMTELAQELHALGHTVTVLTTTPHYNEEPEARARQPLTPHWGRWLYRSELPTPGAPIPVYHAAIPVKGDRVAARLLDYLRFHLISTLAGLFALPRHAVQLVPSPPLTIGLSAWLLRLGRGTPFIYNVQEIYPDIAVSLGLLRHPLAIRLLTALERFIYARAHTVTVISEWFRRRLLAKGVPAAKLVVIPNFVDTEFIRPGPKANPFTHAHHLADKFVVLYAGNIGLTQSLETILAAARQLTDLPDLRLLIVGDGARRPWLAQELARAPLPNVLLLPYQPRSTVPHLYAAADLCLVPLKRGAAQETFPSKIYTIMAAGRPVLTAADPASELAWIVEHAACGRAVPPDDPAALAHAIRAAHADRATLAQQGAQGRAYVVAHHSRAAVARQYHDLITRITAAQPPFAPGAQP